MSSLFSNPQGLKSLTSERLQAVAAHLQGTQITCGDYSSLMLAGDRRTLIYCDAPYHIRRATTRSDRLYSYPFGDEDHVRFAGVCNNCPCQVLVSYNDTPLIRQLFQGWRIIELTWRYRLANRDLGRELLIANY